MMGSLYSRKQEGSAASSARVQAAIGLTPWAAKVRAGIGFAFRPGSEGSLNAAGGKRRPFYICGASRHHTL